VKSTPVDLQRAGAVLVERHRQVVAVQQIDAVEGCVLGELRDLDQQLVIGSLGRRAGVARGGDRNGWRMRAGGESGFGQGVATQGDIVRKRGRNHEFIIAIERGGDAGDGIEIGEQCGASRQRDRCRRARPHL
jgi:hypothetical protein